MTPRLSFRLLLLLPAWGCTTTPGASRDDASNGFVARDAASDPRDGGGLTETDGNPGPDASLPDSGSMDGPSPDAKPADAALQDATVPDGALPDGALPDGAFPDGALPDGAFPDGAFPDGLAPDAFEGDAGLCAIGDCDGENTDDAFQDDSSLGGPWIAIRWVPDDDLVVTGLEVFTGERAGENGLSLWSSVANSPGALLSGGVFQADVENKWQGAPLDAPVPVEADVVYWIVWRPVPGAQSSFGPPGQGVGVAYRGSGDQGRSWNGPFQAPVKFRVLCCQ